MGPLLVLLLLTAPADDLFEAGVDYLRKGFFARSRMAFAESLLAAPGEPVTAAFLGAAAAAEGRPARDVATILRRAIALLPPGKSLSLDLSSALPGPGSLERLKRHYRDAPEVLAFLEVFDADPEAAPALDRLRRDSPADPYAERLEATRPRRAGRAPGSSPTTPPTASGSPSASSAAGTDRIRTPRVRR